jgi:hypothetical protein
MEVRHVAWISEKETANLQWEKLVAIGENKA